ncbi:Mercuric ion reductase [Geitlerinema sp. FC II]|nr:Mercuric ion reductase [Geitlerinema sp. FC II]
MFWGILAFPHPPQRSRSRATRTVSVESASGRCHNIQGRDLQAIANGSQTMGVEYDWVVLGDSTAGMRAASVAAGWGARVALILPPQSVWAEVQTSQIALEQLQRLTRERERSHAWGVAATSGIDRHRVWRICREITENLQALRSPAGLAMQGIDVVVGEVDFLTQPQLTAIAAERKFPSRAYLLAPSAKPTIPPIQGLEDTAYYDLTTLEKLLHSELPPRIAVVGNDPHAVSVARTFAWLGVDVALLTEASQVLPKEDPQMARLVRAHLEACGVTVLTRTPVLQARRIQDTTWLQAGDRALETDAVVVAAGWEAQTREIDWKALGIRRQGHRIRTNPRLQTTNPQIYACGSVLGGYNDPELARYEGDIATKNALFLPLWNADYHTFPRVLAIEPHLAAVGLTEPQAKRRLGDRLVVLTCPFYRLASAQRQDDRSGFGKLLVSPDGNLLGAHFLGARAPALVEAIALLMSQNRSIEALASLHSPDTEVFSYFLTEWRDVWRHQHPRLRNLLQAWFDWRRD